MVRGKPHREVKRRCRKVSGCLKHSQMKGYQLLISSHFCSVGEQGIGWKLHSTVDALSGLWGPQLTFLCRVGYEALFLKGRRVNRTSVKFSMFHNLCTSVYTYQAWCRC